MVKKLIKHEYLAFFRSMCPICAITLGVGLLTRIIQLFESDSAAYAIISGSAFVVFWVSVMVALVATIALSVKRFYTNLFTAEGYLSMTLPVTAGQHIFAKLLVAVTGSIATFITVLISASVSCFGKTLWEIIKAIDFLARDAVAKWGAHFIFYVIEAVIMAVVFITYNFVVFYLCISIGQRAKKNRILAAFGAYFGYYVITQIVGTMFILILTAMPRFLEKLIFDFSRWAVEHPYAAVHVVMLGISVFYAALSVGIFFYSRYIIKNKLNLE